jgi:hypothetical protein
VKASRTHVRREIVLAKRQYFTDQLTLAGNDPKRTWNVLRPFLSCHTPHSPLEIKLDQAILCNPPDIAEAFNQHFIDSVQDLIRAIPIGNIVPTCQYPRPLSCCFQFEAVGSVDISKHLQKAIKKSAGLNSVPGKLISIDIDYFTSLMTDITNESFRTSKFPSIWKRAVVDPCFKAGDNCTLSNYRPLVKLPNLSKVIEGVAYEQVVSYLATHNLLYRYQSGFRKAHSTLTAITDVLNDLLDLRDQGLFVATIFVDFRKAFDVINHNILKLKLQNQFGFHESASTWIMDYLTNREQCVRIQDYMSNFIGITSGVPQGSILGPLIYLLYVNDIQCGVRNARLKLFADDTALIVSAENPADLITNCQQAIDHLASYCSINQLFIHPGKTKLMFFQHMRNTNTDVCCQGNKLEVVTTYKYLGYIIDNQLSFKPNCIKIAGKIATCRALLYRCSRFLPGHCLNLIANSLAMSHINFAHTTIVVSDCTAFNRIKSAYDSLCRLLFYHGISWPTISHRLLTLNMKLLIRILTDEKFKESYLSTCFTLETRSRRTNHFKIKFVNSRKATKSFNYWAPRLLNLFDDINSLSLYNAHHHAHQLLHRHDNALLPYNGPNNVMRYY